jgi:hypothetical protein
VVGGVTDDSTEAADLYAQIVNEVHAVSSREWLKLPSFWKYFSRSKYWNGERYPLAMR